MFTLVLESTRLMSHNICLAKNVCFNLSVDIESHTLMFTRRNLTGRRKMQGETRGRTQRLLLFSWLLCQLNYTNPNILHLFFFCMSLIMVEVGNLTQIPFYGLYMAWALPVHHFGGLHWSRKCKKKKKNALSDWGLNPGLLAPQKLF